MKRFFLRARLHRLNPPISRLPQVFFVHRVIDDQNLSPEDAFMLGLPGQAIPQKLFYERLLDLKQRTEFIPLEELEKLIRHPFRLNCQVSVLTFDDCYSDFLKVSYPVLEELEIPATFFISSHFINRSELLWFDQVYSSLMGTSEPVFELSILGKERYSLDSREKAINIANRTCAVLTNLSCRERYNVLEELVRRYGAGPLNPKSLYLTEEDVFELSSKPGITIASHSDTHPNLLQLTGAELTEELANSKRKLEALTGKPVRYFSYPNGLWNTDIARRVKECGYSMAFSTHLGTWRFRYAIPRFNLGNCNQEEFRVKTSSLGYALTLWKRDLQQIYRKRSLTWWEKVDA